MGSSERELRLQAELSSLQLLKAASSIFDFEAEGVPPEQYVLLFRGRGLARMVAADAKVEPIDLHRVEVRLTSSFPDSPPDIRWLTPLFHPNVSCSGLTSVSDLGLLWEKRLGLDYVAERLWDVARLAYVNPDQPINFAAHRWLAEQRDFSLPVDTRPLRDLAASSSSNVVRYERRGERRLISPVQSSPPREVLYIGEETPTPELPVERVPLRRPAASSGDVLYIGDE